MSPRSPGAGGCLALAVAALVALVLFALGRTYQECERRDGTLVRGLVWYTCAARP